MNSKFRLYNCEAYGTLYAIDTAIDSICTSSVLHVLIGCLYFECDFIININIAKHKNKVAYCLVSFSGAVE